MTKIRRLRLRKLPSAFENFRKTYPEMFRAYEQLGKACQDQGPLDTKTRALTKLAISIGARLEGATHSHTRRALEAGATPNEIRHVIFLALTTIGFPSMMAALTWVDEVLNKPGGNARAVATTSKGPIKRK
ncbi:MAG: carboxymuconolactone decarboxylase family protein [Acidobacteria bacterium]|nr:carboxymuconolactone decarboxylase family protein [Acidobacteriota bacterium]MBI3654972.1 carboxymuconolactone decarboxylase family protein [Acidobacteriota bacterium]